MVTKERASKLVAYKLDGRIDYKGLEFEGPVGATKWAYVDMTVVPALDEYGLGMLAGRPAIRKVGELDKGSIIGKVEQLSWSIFA